MKMDFWKFDRRALKESVQGLPNNILKEQADILSEKTDGVIYGRIINIKFEPQDEDVTYNLATLFDIVVPQLDNYNYTLLIMYSRPESDYPIAITVGSSVMDDAEWFAPQYECQDKEGFIHALKTILSSDEVNKKISTLYAKANF